MLIARKQFPKIANHVYQLYWSTLLVIYIIGSTDWFVLLTRRAKPRLFFLSGEIAVCQKIDLDSQHQFDKVDNDSEHATI